MPRGWTTVDLVTVDEDERLWTVTQAAQLLGKDPGSVRWLIKELNIPPVGMQRQSGSERRGRQPRVYRAIDFIRAYDNLSRAA
jgi:hypothetical protein